MKYLLIMGIIQRGGSLNPQFCNLTGRQYHARILKQRIQPVTVNALHDKVMEPMILTDPEYRDDIGVMESSGRPRFMLKPSQLFIIGQQGFRKHLQGNPSPQ